MRADALTALCRDVEERARSIAARAGGWPCRKGCDACCRRLASVPRLTRPEWDLLSQGCAALPAAVRREVSRRLEGLAVAVRPVVCPLLDLSSGACLVYFHRPAACRAYGFYVQRDAGLYCGIIQERVETGEYRDVVWGNYGALERRLGELGEARDLRDWFGSCHRMDRAETDSSPIPPPALRSSAWQPAAGSPTSTTAAE